MNVGARALRTLDVASRVSAVLDAAGVGSAVIGGVALAVHGYVRATRDLDLAIAVVPGPGLDAIANGLRGEGLTVEWSPPGTDDELGGVLTVLGEDLDPVQVVNFLNPPASGRVALVREALASASVPPGFPLRVIDVPHLAALKLSTGAFRDEVDVAELLRARAGGDLQAVRDVCDRHGLGAALDRALSRPGAV